MRHIYIIIYAPREVAVSMQRSVSGSERHVHVAHFGRLY